MTIREGHLTIQAWKLTSKEDFRASQSAAKHLRTRPSKDTLPINFLLPEAKTSL